MHGEEGNESGEARKTSGAQVLPAIASLGSENSNAGAPQAHLDGKAIRKKCVPHFAPSHDFLFHLSDETNGIPKDPPPLLKQFIHQMQISAGCAGQRKQRVMPPHMLPPKAATVSSSYSFSRRDQAPPMTLAGGAPSRVAPRQALHAGDTGPQHAPQEDSQGGECVEHQGPPPLVLGDSRFAFIRGHTPSASSSRTPSRTSYRSVASATPSSARTRDGSFVSEERMRQIEETIAKDQHDRHEMMNKLDQLQQLMVLQTQDRHRKRGFPGSVHSQAGQPLRRTYNGTNKIPKPPATSSHGKGGMFGASRTRGCLPSRDPPWE